MWRFKSHADRLAVICESGLERTYRDLQNFAAEISKTVPGRQLVFCLCSNTFGSLAGYTAFLKNRIVPLLLSANLNRSLLDRLIETYRPSFLWAPSSFVSNLPIAMERDSYKLLQTGFDSPPLHHDLALLLTTSGSTGSPNLVRQSYGNLTANTASIVEYLGLDENERPITTLPMEYTYGLSILNTHLAVGATILLTTKTLMQREFWSFFREQRATSFAGVPYTYEMLKRLRFATMDLPSLKTMTQAGGKLSLPLHREFAQFAEDTHRRFFVMYGQAEATARMSYLPPDQALEKCGSIGIAIPGGELSLVEGEIVYRGPNVALGYARSAADLALGDENQGVLATGDIASRDAEGFFFISGRKKRFIKIFGNRVNLDEVERLVQTAFPDLGVACAGRDDRMSVYLTGEDRASEVKHFLAEKTGLNLTAFAVTMIDSIPRSDAGKPLYAELELCGR